MDAVAEGFNVLALLGVKPASTGSPRKVGSGSMESRIALITILTDDVPRLVAFYRDVLGFVAENPSDDMTEFVSAGVRFAICNRTELVNFDASSRVSANRRAGKHLNSPFPAQRKTRLTGPMRK